MDVTFGVFLTGRLNAKIGYNKKRIVQETHAEFFMKQQILVKMNMANKEDPISESHKPTPSKSGQVLNLCCVHELQCMKMFSNHFRFQGFKPSFVFEPTLHHELFSFIISQLKEIQALQSKLVLFFLLIGSN